MHLEILIGNIASGKSTYCRKKAKDGSIIVNDDSIVNCIHANNYQLYCDKLKPLYKSVENQIIVGAVSFNRPIIIDRGLNLTTKSRRRYIGLAHSLDYECYAVIFPFENPEKHAERRINDDGRNYGFDYWCDVAQFKLNQYEEPSTLEGFDKILYHEENSNSLNNRSTYVKV